MKKKNNRIPAFSTLFFWAVFLAGCSLEHLLPDPEHKAQEQAKVILHVTVPMMTTSPLTRVDETTIATMHVMTFDASGNMTDAPRLAVYDRDIITGGYVYIVDTLNASADLRRVFIIVNGAAELAACESGLGGWKVVGRNGITTTTSTKLSDVASNLKTPNLNTRLFGANTYIIEQPSMAPPVMTGYVEMTDGLVNGMIITNYDSGNPTPVPLVRIMAKFTVETSGVVNNFTLLGASMGYAPLNGLILPQTPLPLSTLRYHYASNASTDDGAGYITFVGPAVGGNSIEELSCYENNNILNPTHQNDLCVFLKATYNGFTGYYRIDIVDGELKDLSMNRHRLNIERNTWYRIVIHTVNERGYSTIAEAAANRALNIEYTVTHVAPSTDIQDDAHDIKTNGDYSLGVSNSIFYAYSNDTGHSAHLTAVTVTHTAPSTVTTARIKVEGNGLKLISPTPTFPSLQEGVFAVGTKKFPIVVEMESAFKYGATDGKITITLGTLEKVIYVYRRPAVHFNTNILTDFSTTTCVTAVVSSMFTPPWLRFSTNGGVSTLPEIKDSPTGNIQVVFEPNIAMSGATPRTESVYFSQKNNAGRIKATFTQSALNVNDIVETPLDPTYVGAFWRANQRGERMVRIPVTGTANLGPWRADVIWLDGQWNRVANDGVALSLDGFDSGSLSTRGISWTNMLSSPSDPDTGGFYVTGNAVSVGGTLSANGHIEFRIGPQSTYTPTLNDPVRYGLALLTYGVPAKMQKIYLRQGDDADYLMRPTDNVPNNAVPSRDHAKKFSPYNLTAQTFNTAVTINGSVGANPGMFTLYPTMSGAFFQWANVNATRYAWTPNGTYSGWQNNAPATYWDAIMATHESCPINYRRPTDGVNNGPITVLQATAVESEMRQSLYLNPLNGQNNSTDNSVWGYYADGYFDRRAITVAPGVTGSGLTAVSQQNSDVAYIGRLFFNPNTNASLFFPASGGRRDTDGTHIDAGVNAFYLSSSSFNTTHAWGLEVTNPNARQTYTLRQSGALIRCVYHKCVPVAGVSVNASSSTTVATGGTVSLTTSVTPIDASPPYTYLWQRSFDNGTTWLDLTTTPGPTNNAIAVWPGVTKYRVVITNSCGGPVVSAPIDITGNTVEIPPPTGFVPYVGAFWKNNQRGERLIRMNRTSSGSADGGWGVWVVEGDTWISIDDHPSSDTQLGWLVGNDNNVVDMMANDASHTVPGATIALHGKTLDSSSPTIYFRIGLRGVQASTAAPRYGVVLLTYGNHNRGQRIFIRQGETADFLMRPTDNAPNGAVSSRSDARKFSPYNLKDPAENTVNSYNSVPALGYRGGVSVDYPTQAGYFFHYNTSTQAFHPTLPVSGNFSGWSSALGHGVPIWNYLNDETCPVDYRRPKDGVSHNVAGTVAGSEIRQSLWLNPAAGAPTTGGTDNSVFGYYADGYFDRRVIGNIGSTTNTVVSPNNSKAAYIGKLFFNPNNKASLFFPLNGYRISNGGELTAPGFTSYYWTSSSYDTQFAWSMYLTTSMTMVQNLIRTAGFSVRCVYEVGVSSVSLVRTDGGGALTVGSRVPLLATVFPGTAENVRYEWQFYNGTTWITIGETNTNTFNAPVLWTGTNANQYRVIASNGNGTATSNSVYVTGTMPTGPGTPPSVVVYGGAFWRAGEIGERVIRIGVNSDATNTGDWVATVSWLDAQWGPSDGVIFAMGDSPDPNIRTANPGNPEAAANLVTGNVNLIHGVVSANGYITFRIGLKTPYTPTLANPVRYGIVLLTYGDNKFQRIFIRQGHDPDYLMRPPMTGLPQGDLNSSGTAVADNRIYAKKFSPYNLKDPLDRVQTNHASGQHLGQFGAVFTNYPTKIGYVLGWNVNTFAGAPVTGYSVGGWNQNMTGSGTWGTYPNTPMETCPNNFALSSGLGTVNFRRPNDGSTTAYVPTSSVSGSEIRQSLWLDPQSNGTSNTNNSFWCYYADGYYDRRPIDVNHLVADAPAPGNAGVHVASAGRLFFNPYNNASLFFPAGGEGYGVTNASMRDRGVYGRYWTSTCIDTQDYHAYFLYFNGATATMGGVVSGSDRGRSFLHTIRCVQN